MSKKLSQNIQAIVGEIGELAVLLRLAILSHLQSGWQVFRNIGEAGYHILLQNEETETRIRIEVKTRQRLYSIAKRRNQIQFQLTRVEHDACDVLIGYWLDRNELFVVPKKHLKPVDGGKRYRFTIGLNKLGEPHSGCARFSEAWELLHPDFFVDPETSTRINPNSGTCPKCRSSAVRRIVYGLPGPRAEELARTGRITLGGCCYAPDVDPDWLCDDCGIRWRNDGQIVDTQQSESN